MKCPYHSEMGCAKFDLLPCVGLDNCAYMNGSSNLLQGIQTPYAELKAQKEKAESELKAIREVITRYENGSCLQKCIRPCSDCLAKEIIKQIGGVK